ncbi:hypothetical protein [Pseudomonas sp. GD03746]|uniref:hypothetical protein n=1 Tax=Pseudomonas sp. GD03746 TaxID=2975378 RepID=UPI0024472B8D|nr:hypothetical protein [Pseudomonas sp. GD03746]MDH1574180.1 hypothetical protein [Pseudomonas sp. GD03746]
MAKMVCRTPSDSEYFKYPLYPVENGLIPVGVTDNGDCIFWVVTSKQNSDEWHVAIIASRSPEIEYFKDNLTAVLEGLLIGRLSSSSLPSGLLLPAFVSISFSLLVIRGNGRELAGHQKGRLRVD